MITALEHFGTAALGGGPLASWNVTRFVHLDEAGIATNDPVCVEAGVIVDADAHWKELEWQLRTLKRELIPDAKQRDGFVFHAKNIFHGGCKVFSRERYPNPLDRAKIVARIAGIGSDMNLPIAIGAVERQHAPVDKTVSADIANARIHSLAYLLCVAQVDYWMRGYAANEVATLFVEDNTRARRLMRIAHDALSDPEMAAFLPFEINRSNAITHVVETPNFQEKSEFSLLQIADACAFSAARVLKQGSLNEVLKDAITDRVISWPW